MAIVQPNGFIDNILVKAPIAHSVWVKEAWADEWQFVQYMDCLLAKDAAPPTLPVCQLKWNYGNIKQFEDADYVQHDPFWLMDWYVQVLAHTAFGDFIVWTGMIQKDSLDIFAIDSSQGITPGDQFLGAFGIDYVLQRRRINWTFINGGPDDGGSVTTRPEVFNRPFARGQQISGGNRSSTRNSAGVYTFSTDGDDWTFLDIVEYVLHFFQPSAIPFLPTGQTDIIDQISGEPIDLWGLTPYDALNKLIPRRRGVGWTIDTIGEGDAEIFIYSLASDPITFSEFTLPANTYQDTMIFDDLVDIKPRISLNRDQLFDTIEVTGAQIKCCFSVALSNVTLEEGWTAAEQTAYEAANDEERVTDKHSRVYSFFRIPNDWDHTFEGLDGAGPEFINPVVLDDGTVDLTTQDSFWLGGLTFRRFLDQLPLLVETEKPNAASEYRKPFALVEDPDNADEFHYVERLDVIELEEYSFRNSDRETGFYVVGRLPHQFALNNFTDNSPDGTDVDEEIDSATLIATVFLETDTQLRVVSRLVANEQSEAGRTLVIAVPGAEYWWQAGGTVTDVTDAALVFGPSAGLVLRDDSARLRAIALAASSWYGKQRAAIRYVHQGIAPFHPVGMMIRNAATTAFDLEPVGTVVTSRTWDFRTMEMTVETGYSELDTAALVGTAEG